MTQRHTNKQVPEILAQEIVAQSKLFKIEQLQLRFSNGAERTYERMRGAGRGAVMIVACPDPEHFYLIREYSAGTHDYQLGFPKGLIDPGEDVLAAANRELKEEIGFGAGRFIALKSLALAPGYFNATMHIVLAFDLYPEQQEGDEPEPLELISWARGNSDLLLQQVDFTEARSVAALLLAQQYLEANPDVFKQTA
ncbi:MULTISPECIES: ADP compounds hydrolase NudE [unclassified Arsukibacterium]|uniref:ADP compounds hydrolase NudE n=1 Tax=unclassified Arsukibacterium TaxID=2635278 RepID=UPI000C3CF0CA|nr:MULTISPECIES: ADP compounds hydrolase NudE [unclassified Arsukibacterium]MAA94870.1 ADP compounds hydrolase NudE [Rheinheimera sp.]MBM34673.1 ADP compounds hydrolase NudE [Rheinheimera sp.]HAW92987.1 ADP compounds hydrolase NudE [Candidatus Azambacteria bacterium]|tara:strand:- start:24 stop:611 length:588 start_codon:yes stop_codon:yes gene_type:complete